VVLKYQKQNYIPHISEEIVLHVDADPFVMVAAIVVGAMAELFLKKAFLCSKIIMGYENAPTPSGVLAASPAITAIHVKARVKILLLCFISNPFNGLANFTIDRILINISICF
jgi:hypothetical protein